MYSNKMNLDSMLYKMIAVQDAAIHYPDSYGVEVELEGKNFVSPPANVRTHWFQIKDGSLRVKEKGDEAAEYVTRQPYDIQDTYTAINNLFNYLNSPEVEIYDSYRTSIHVHVNFAKETFLTIYNFMTLNLILDELLVSQNGEHRIGNNFCLRSKDALGQVQSLIRSINNGNNFFDIPQNDRYSSINFASLRKFGSIEFRSLECTTHEGRLMHWIGTLAELKKNSKLYKNPVEIIRQFSELGPNQFLMKVLGPFALKYLHVNNFEEMLFNGMRIAQDLAYCSEWNGVTIQDRQAAEAERLKIMNEMANKLKPKQPVLPQKINMAGVEF